jgi:SNF2-related domain
MINRSFTAMSSNMSAVRMKLRRGSIWSENSWPNSGVAGIPLAGLLKTDLLPYQVRGAIFVACRGRVVLADDIGLGKTVQALAATELLRRHRGISNVVVVAPASVKYQWKKEIEKFTGLSSPSDRRSDFAATKAIRLPCLLQPLRRR